MPLRPLCATVACFGIVWEKMFVCLCLWVIFFVFHFCSIFVPSTIFRKSVVSNWLVKPLKIVKIQCTAKLRKRMLHQLQIQGEEEVSKQKIHSDLIIDISIIVVALILFKRRFLGVFFTAGLMIWTIFQDQYNSNLDYFWIKLLFDSNDSIQELQHKTLKNARNKESVLLSKLL